MDKAASSISDGDLVDALIHGYDNSPFVCMIGNADERSLSQTRAALGIDAVACCVLHRPTGFIPLRSRCWLRWPQRYVVPSVRLHSLRSIQPLTQLVSRFLGQNSKQGKLNRQLGDVQIRMRLKVSGDKSEIRQSYLPALFPHIVKPLMDVGAVCLVGDKDSRRG
jgi:replication factor C subunit 1